MRKSLGEIARDWKDEELYAEFRGELTRTISYESEITEDHHEVKEQAKRKESMPLRFTRRTRHWTDGFIIGNKAFMQEIACQFQDQDRVLKKQLSSGRDLGGTVLHCFRRLRSAKM